MYMQAFLPARRMLGVLLLSSILAACTTQVPTPGPRAWPLAPCPLDGPGVVQIPAGSTLVAPGTIVFGWDVLTNASPDDLSCGAQAITGGSSTFSVAALGGEDRIPWAATLARSGRPTAPDPVMPKMTLVRTDPDGTSVVVATQIGEPVEMYRMLGNYGHDATPGLYLMRIVSGTNELLAVGRFEVIP